MRLNASEGCLTELDDQKISITQPDIKDPHSLLAFRSVVKETLNYSHIEDVQRRAFLRSRNPSVVRGLRNQACLNESLSIWCVVLCHDFLSKLDLCDCNAFLIVCALPPGEESPMGLVIL